MGLAQTTAEMLMSQKHSTPRVVALAVTALSPSELKELAGPARAAAEARFSSCLL
jgi:hypothetical protein